MPKKRAKEEKKVEVEEFEPLEVVEVEDFAPPANDPVTPVKVKASQIAALFPELGDIEGVPFDAGNPDHQIVAAFLVGSRGLLRR